MGAFFLLLLSLTAEAAGPVWPQTDIPRFWILGEGSTHFSLDGSYFYTRENYDAEGVPQQPLRMEHVRYTNIRLHGALGFTPRLSLFAQSDLRGVFASNRTGSNVSDDDNYGFGDTFLAARWLMYRSRPSDRVYPTEWAPETWMAMLESSWAFPLYDRAKSGKPPLGDQSNDFTGMLKLAWYANDWLGLSGGAGYTYRTAGYSASLPWMLRADFLFLDYRKFRLWVEFRAEEGLTKSTNVLNLRQPDPVPGDSLLFKSYAPTQRGGTLGFGYRLGREWEVSLAGYTTASGVNSAKGFGGGLGFAWRPYQIPEIKYDDYRRAQIKRLENEPRRYRSSPVARYGFSATITRVSTRGNFLRINYGSRDGLKTGDTFEIFEPDQLQNRQRAPIAFARVEAVRADASFLRVERRYEQGQEIRAGFEARRVVLSEDGGDRPFVVD